MKSKKTSVFMCDSCGNESLSWSGRCNFCGEWNTLKELKINSNVKVKSKSEVLVRNLSEVEVTKNLRIKTQIEEFDRVLGGGIVPGSVILLGGEPGIGKSTLILQICEKVKNVFYLSGEESANQIKLRADRLGIKEGILISNETDLELVSGEVAKNSPDLLVVDSIQTSFLGSVPSTPGNAVQLKECGLFLQNLAKNSNTSVVIIGHVTKDGTISGPRTLEHLVDVVLYLEGDRFHDARLLRTVKNRFGATNEVGIFCLQSNGLQEIKNPSELFISERSNAAGSVVTSTLEGTRPLLVEIQALVAPTSFGYPKRTSSGFDLNRLNLLTAVISKRTNINLSNSDIYLNVAGGMRVGEPSCDLAVALAMISSYKNRALPQQLCVFGEIGLSGEIRRVTRQSEREKEAKSLGFSVIENAKSIVEFERYFKLT